VEEAGSTTATRLRALPARAELAVVFAGGAAGALARSALTQALPVRVGAWPWTTFSVNVAGALLIGYWATQLSGERAGRRRALLTSGVCGAFTTFSTVMLELQRLLDSRHVGLAAGYLAASVVAGLGAVMVGRALALRRVPAVSEAE
jgi:CrcB protein